MSGVPVVVTGVGAVTPSGHTVPALWRSVSQGRSAISPLPGHLADVPARAGGWIRDFRPPPSPWPVLRRRLSPVQQWAVAAADEAVGRAVGTRHRGLPWDAPRISVIAATGSGPVDLLQHATRTIDARGPRQVSPTLPVYGTPDAIAGLLSRRYGSSGTAHAVSAACASRATGLGEGLRRIRHGYADAVLVVGMEDCLTPVYLAAHANLRTLAATGDHVALCRPFDRARTGLVVSQGAAAMLLESAVSAAARDAPVLARLRGYGATTDTSHPTAPDPAGRAAARAVEECLKDAGLTPDDVDHVNAHGTGTLLGDAAEIAALDTVFDPRRARIPVTATKSSTGHLLGASGVAEAIIAIMTLRDQLLPPTLNLDDPDFVEWDFVTGTARPHPVRTVLSPSFGFGGHSGALLFSAPA